MRASFYVKHVILIIMATFCYVTLKAILFITMGPIDSSARVMLAIGTVSYLTTTMETDLEEDHKVEEKLPNSTCLKQDFIVKCPGCDAIVCKRYLDGNASVEQYAAGDKWMKRNPHRVLNESEYMNLTKNCNKFKTRGYHVTPVDEEEANFPLAFNLLIHDNIEQFEFLLRSIYRPQNVYCIHVDRKSKKEFVDAVSSVASCFDNVFIASQLEWIVYAGFSRLQADINCMRDLVQHPVQWKYLLNTAGQAFPLRTNLEMVKILKLYNGMNDVEGIYGKRVLRSRFKDKWIELRGANNTAVMNKTGLKNPPPPHDIDIVRGSAYATFSREFVNFILTDQKAIDLLEWSKTTYSPDEHYFATLHHTYSNPHLATPGGYKGYPSEKEWLSVHVAWGGEEKCGGMWRRGVCVFGIRDLQRLTKKRHFFANKFYMSYQPLALQCMNSWLEHRVQCPPTFDENYYSSLKFIPKESVRS